MTGRGKWQGVANIARFNWPLYLAAATVLMASTVGWFFFREAIFRVVCAIGFACAAYFIAGSLSVSHLIYDRSDLYRWNWLAHALRQAEARNAILCHSGFDEASEGLRRKFGGMEWKVLDHFDAQHMTEASIRRARTLFPPASGTVSATHDAWPVAAESVDLILGLLAIHELRSEAERAGWFAECRRCIRRNGRVVLVEHVRDAANFLAFGPGFLHFHSAASWRRCWQSAGLQSVEEFRLTPFLRVFILRIP